MAPPGTHVIVHYKPDSCTSWGHHSTPCWYIGPSLENYRFMKCYMTATDILIINDTLQYIPKAFAFPRTAIEDYLKQSIGDIIKILKYPLKTLLFLFYGDAKNILTDQIAQIL